MRKFTFILVLTLLFSCVKDDHIIRSEKPGPPSSIRGNVKDIYRNINIPNFEIKLMKSWWCSSGGILRTNTCKKEVTSVYTDVNGNYQLDYEYNLKDDETYYIRFNETDSGPFYYYNFFDSSNKPTYSYSLSDLLVSGEKTVFNINAWKPITIKFNLTILNNHTPPLHTNIFYDGVITNHTSSNINYEDGLHSFEMEARPNSEIKIQFWYIENYNSKNPTSHYAPIIKYTTDESDTKLDFEINCNDF